MNIRDFQYLIAIDELKNFIKAAEKCNISQPALSQQIQKIEMVLDCQIFERNHRQIITTEIGKKIIHHAKIIVENFDIIKNVQNNKINLTIGLIPTICPYLLPLIADKICDHLPEVKFYFHELKTEDLITKLKIGQLDFGIIAYFPHLIDSHIKYHKLYDEEFLLALPNNSNDTEADFEDILASKKLMLLKEGNCMSDNIKEICSIYKQNSFSDFSATNIETIRNMIRINNGAGLLPKLACLNEKNLKLIQFKQKKYREIGIITRSSSQNQNYLIKLANIIKTS
ncbi:MAG: LysR family transcriptional regulator, partial [Rickettsiales bacterium]|nr:LysR family transcriptional regulator [Rickettsiales bacterium]